MSSQPTITSKNLPQPGQAAPTTPTPAAPAKQVLYKDIIAKPLRTPNFINLKPRNPNISIRWVNCSVGEKESKLRFNQAQAQGFECVEPKDVMDELGGPCPSALIRDNRVIYGDLILMKMARVDYIGALKYNEERAIARVKKPGIAMSGSKTEHQDSEGRELPGAAGFPSNEKVRVYVPPLTEIENSVK